MTYTLNRNEQFNSIEIIFDGKPSEEVRDALKALKFRWHGVKKLWYGRATEEDVKAAIEGGAVTKRDVNGVKVGDLFSMSWGYEQTNVDFFQVVALSGSSSVRVRHVQPEMISESANSGMSAYRTYRTHTNGAILPAVSSVFIKDNEKGDIKRVSSGEAPYLKIGNHHAHLCKGETESVYESWYY